MKKTPGFGKITNSIYMLYKDIFKRSVPNLGTAPIAIDHKWTTFKLKRIVPASVPY